MSPETPNIIFRCQFIPPRFPKPVNHKWKNAKEWQSRRNYYTCNNGGYDVLDYNGRDEAADKTLLACNVDDEVKMEYFSNVDYGNHLSYMGRETAATGFFNGNGDLTVDQLEIFKKQIQHTKSIVWDAVVSFKAEFSEIHEIKTKRKALEILSKAMPQFLEKSHLDSQNINWIATFHLNTDHYHCHLLFFENHAQTKIGAFTNRATNAFKFYIQNAVMKSSETYEQLTALRNLIIGASRKEIENKIHLANYGINEEIINEMTKLASRIPKRATGYNHQATQQLRNDIDIITQKLIFTNKKLYDIYREYEETVNKHQQKLENINIENKLAPNNNEFKNKRLQDLKTRLGNIIFKEAKTMHSTNKPITPYFTNPKNNDQKIKVQKRWKKQILHQKFFKQLEKEQKIII